MWDFETDEEYQGVLSWVDEFVTKKVEPLDTIPISSDRFDLYNRRLKNAVSGPVTLVQNWVDWDSAN